MRAIAQFTIHSLNDVEASATAPTDPYLGPTVGGYEQIARLGRMCGMVRRGKNRTIQILYART